MACDIAALRAEVKANQLQLKLNYEQTQDARAVLVERCRQVDAVLKKLWDSFDFPASMSLAAVGGYGRGELYPASDIDLLILLSQEANSVVQDKLERLIGSFWDIGLEIGHSVRTIQDCLNEAAGDITVQTSLLEARLLTGNNKLFATKSACAAIWIRWCFSRQSALSSKIDTYASTRPHSAWNPTARTPGRSARLASHFLDRQGCRLRDDMGRTPAERHHHARRHDAG
jgi:UTP:GlnB (protein PII) uridylyltransferase